MIVADRKPFDDLNALAKKHEKILVLGCGSCVTVCMAGGDKEVDILCTQLQLAAKEEGRELSIEQHTIVRQCDQEFFDEQMSRKVEEADVVISMACGVGVQYCAEQFPDKIVYPALNTQFFGANIEQGEWAERCGGCGECVLDKYGGVCPIARCSKSLMNGPCGGSSNGKCEVDPENTDCAWQLIYDRLQRLDQLENLEENQDLKDWSQGRDGGPRKTVREDVKL